MKIKDITFSKKKVTEYCFVHVCVIDIITENMYIISIYQILILFRARVFVRFDEEWNLLGCLSPKRLRKRFSQGTLRPSKPGTATGMEAGNTGSQGYLHLSPRLNVDTALEFDKQRFQLHTDELYRRRSPAIHRLELDREKLD